MENLRKIKYKLLLFLFLTFLFFSISFFYASQINPSDFEAETKKFQSILLTKEKIADEAINNILYKIESITADTLFFDHQYFDLCRKENIIILVYQESILKYWSDNSINASDAIFLKPNFNLFSNAWYEIRKKEINQFLVVGLIKIKNAYPFENQYLNNGFLEEFKLPLNTEVSKDESDYSISNRAGDYLFSIKFPHQIVVNENQSLILTSLYSIAFIFLIITLVITYSLLSFYVQNRNILFLGLLFDILLIRWITFYFEIPNALYSLDLFKPSIYASSDIFPSLGDLLFNSFTILALAFVVLKKFKIAEWLNLKTQWLKYFGSIIFLNLIFILFYFLNSSLGSIITDSKISFDLFNITTINSYSIIGLLCFWLLILSFIFLTFEIAVVFVKVFINWKLFWAILIITSSLFFLICRENKSCNSYTVFFLIAYLFLFRFNLKSGSHYLQLSTVLFFLLVFSILSTYITFQANNKNEKEQRLLLSQKLSNPRDFAAEFLFNEISTKAQKDSILIKLFNTYNLKNPEAYNEIQDHFRQKYFSRFWDKYDLLITVCDSSKILDIQPDNYTINCFQYFDNLIREYGMETSFDNLIHLDINISADKYIGIIDFPSLHTSTRIYVEVFSKLIPRGLGYPELLMDRKSQSTSNLTSYSWARYEKNEIVYRYGLYQYTMNLSNYRKAVKEQNFFNLNKYNHLFIDIDNDSVLILSKKNPGLIDIVAPFSYFFIFYGFLIGMVFLIYKWPFPLKRYSLNFKKRLQLSIMSLFLFSFIVIGVSSIFYIINLNNEKNIDLLSEKSHSVLIELEHKLAMEETLSPDLQQYVSELLTKLSLIFFSDINLYNLDGNLLATSRSEIFRQGLISQQMNPEAYNQMNNLKNSLYIQNESVGDFKYLSAYLPFRNERNKPIAYLNLPYFAKQDDLTHEISTYLVAFINIYVILTSIAILITLIFSNYISKPVQLIKEKIGKLKLGKQNEKIDWKQEDEIGSLVTEYNRMVDELTKSADQLAKSERESAWREMAKQIAHEIKNPLTPMKLSVQYLQKAWDEKAPDWDQRLKRFTQTLVEQIESLSSIATEFSDFAKMPKSKFEKLELNKVIDNAIGLFRDSNQILFELSYTGKHFVMADNEQLLRVFNNLINNSIQAIADPEKGLIRISVEQDAGFHIIRFTDNGKGIPSEQRSKVFYPSFTTKSGGMGLGLAMVKNIIQNSNGDITFESEVGKGTTFIIELPAHESK